MRSSDVAKETLARAQANSLVTQRLGTPISEGWFVGGSINVSPGSGDADLSVPIAGPKGKGTVYVRAQKSSGTWAYGLMQAVIDGSSAEIDLLANATAGVPQSNPPTPAAQKVADVKPAGPSRSVRGHDSRAATCRSRSNPGSGSGRIGVIASAQYANDPNLRCDLLELKRVKRSGHVSQMALGEYRRESCQLRL